MSFSSAVTALFTLGTLAAGCTRHVTLDPELVPARNDAGWKIVRTPAAKEAAGSAPVPESRSEPTSSVPTAPAQQRTSAKRAAKGLASTP